MTNVARSVGLLFLPYEVGAETLESIGHKRVHDTDSPIQAVVLKVLCKDFREPVVFRVRP